MEKKGFLILVILLALLSSGCALQKRLSSAGSSVGSSFAQLQTQLSTHETFSPSGTLILSSRVPDEGVSAAEDTVEIGSAPSGMAPIIGYIPPALGFVPADNETWLQIKKSSKTLIVYKGSAKVKELKGEGTVAIATGEYALQHKQKRPLWYASDDYFRKRKLNVPPKNDKLRYRRGALGLYAIYPTPTFPIHSGPVWSEDVGGLKVSKADLSAIYYMLPVGSTVKVEN